MKIRAIALVICILGATECLRGYLCNHYLLNITASIPVGIYQSATGEVERGDLALVNTPYRKLPLLKPVVAVGGGEVCIDSDVLLRGLTTTSKTPFFKDKRCYRLREDELFLFSDYSERSFDSRYFGPVKRSQVISKVLPVFVIGGVW